MIAGDVNALELSMLLYVSESLILPRNTGTELAMIVDHSTRRNSALGITGSLVFTGAHFAQVLEGPPENLQALMASIQRDPRHTNIFVCLNDRISTRQFAKWALAYAGPAQYIARQVTAAIATNSSCTFGPSSSGLIRLMKEFAQQAGRNTAN